MPKFIVHIPLKTYLKFWSLVILIISLIVIFASRSIMGYLGLMFNIEDWKQKYIKYAPNYSICDSYYLSGPAIEITWQQRRKEIEYLTRRQAQMDGKKLGFVYYEPDMEIHYLAGDASILMCTSSQNGILDIGEGKIFKIPNMIDQSLGYKNVRDFRARTYAKKNGNDYVLIRVAKYNSRDRKQCDRNFVGSITVNARKLDFFEAINLSAKRNVSHGLVDAQPFQFGDKMIFYVHGSFYQDIDRMPDKYIGMTWKNFEPYTTELIDSQLYKLGLYVYEEK